MAHPKKAGRVLRISFVLIAELFTVGTIAVMLISRDTERLLLACVTVLLVLVPGVLERLFHCRISTTVYLFGIIYATGAMMGHCWKFYYTIPGWDKLLHICGGVMFAIFGFYLFVRMNHGRADHLSAAVFALCFSMAVAVFWEFFEYGADVFFGMDMQNDTVVSGITSYFLGPETGVSGSINNIRNVVINGASLPVDGYLDIGLHDTMLDMLLESLGALVTCVFIWIDKGKHPLIQDA